MDCPVCGEAMIAMELDDIEVDHCLSCGGIWLDAGELELLLGDRAQSEALLKSLPRRTEATKDHRRCPVCGRAMVKLDLGGEKHVSIDECKRHGLWFDRGELRAALSTHSFDPDRKIEKTLGDMFGQPEDAGETA